MEAQINPAISSTLNKGRSSLDNGVHFRDHTDIMKSTSSNIQKNTDYYDSKYQATDLEFIIASVSNYEKYLAFATNTFIDWHGLYAEEFAQRIAGKLVFEIGSGNGLNALIMAKLGAEVTANDISDVGCRIIKRAAAELSIHNIQAINGNFTHLDIQSNKYDFVVGKSFLHHLTYENEKLYLEKIADVLKPDGEARFFEPAVNSMLLEKLRKIIPVPGRPSSLFRNKYLKWKSEDPHPQRDNSTDHFVREGKKYFREIYVKHYGVLERFAKLLPFGNSKRFYMRSALSIEEHLPDKVRFKYARSQCVIYRYPINKSHVT